MFRTIAHAIKQATQPIPWLYRCCRGIYHSRHLPRQFWQFLKHKIKSSQWFRKLFLAVYFLPWLLRRLPRYTSQRIKGAIKHRPWLHQLILKLYRLALTSYHLPSRIRRVSMRYLRTCMRYLLHPIRYSVSAIKRMVHRHPSLLPYATQVKMILKGRVIGGTLNIYRQLIADWHNWRLIVKDRHHSRVLAETYQAAILCAIQNRVDQWWTFLPNSAFDSVSVLQTFLREVVLRRAGDFETFLRLRNVLEKMDVSTVKKDVFFDKVAEHFAAATAEMDSGKFKKQLNLPTSKRPFIIAFYIWGDAYINFFLQYCLASLRSEGNLGALCKERQPIFYIHTTPEGKNRLENSDGMKALQTLNVCVTYNMLNQDIVDCFDDDPNYKYWHMGLIQSLDLYFAKTLDADYHLLVPDTIYSKDHFKGLLEKAQEGYHAITRLGLSARMEGICPAVDAYRSENGSINIPAEDLAAITIENIHVAFNSWNMTHRDFKTEAANMYMMVWEGKDAIYIISPHQTILYLDREIVRKMPKRYFMALDSELNKIIPEASLHYTPKPNDGLSLVEVTSEKERLHISDTRYPIEEFSRKFWYCVDNSLSYWRFFDNTIIDSIDRNKATDRSYMEEGDIEQIIKEVKQELLARQPKITKGQATMVHEILQQLHTEIKNKGLSTHADDTIKFINEQCGELPTKDWKKAPIETTHKNVPTLQPLYQDAMLCCIKHNVRGWWHYIPSMNVNSVTAFHHFLTEYVLRRAGDVNTLLHLRSELKVSSFDTLTKNVFFDELVMHFENVTRKMESGEILEGTTLDKTKQPFVMAVSVWGASYFHILLNYCLPSLMTDGNFGILCKKRQPILFIHTDDEGRSILESSDIIKKMQDMGVVILYQMISKDLTRHFANDPTFKYWHLGLVQSLDIYLAKTLAADYHLLMPDTVYSENHFKGLLNAAEKGHKAIIRLMLSTCMEHICPDIDNYRDDEGVIHIPAADLASLSVKHIHTAFDSWIMTNKNLKDELSSIHVLIWEGEDKLYLHSPHQTILYLDHTLTTQLPKRYFMSLDSELDKIIPDHQPVYCPQAKDEICLIEITPAKARDIPAARNTMDEFCRIFWHSAQQSIGYWRIFDQAVVDSLNRDLLPDRPYMSLEKITKAKQIIQQALVDTYPALTKPQIEEALHIIETLKERPQAKGILPLIGNTAEKIGSQKERGILIDTAYLHSQAMEEKTEDNAALARLYQEAILFAIEHDVPRWWGMLVDSSFESPAILQTFLRECVLRRIGDYKAFLRMNTALQLITDTPDPFFNHLAEHYDAVTNSMDNGNFTEDLILDDQKQPFVIAFSIWGESYIDFFLSYCLPSLMSEGNLPLLLKKRQIIFFIHTNREGRAQLEQCEQTQWLQHNGVVFQYHLMDDIIEQSSQKPEYKYWNIGLVQSMDLYFARVLEADYHLMMPDTIYSANHFEGIINAVERGNLAVTRLGLSAMKEGLCPNIEAYREENNTISVPAADLAALSINHLHPAFEHLLMTNRNIETEMPNIHLMVWEGENTLHLISPHQTILYLDHTITRNIPKRYFFTLDSELDKIIPEDCTIYTPNKKDEICLVEVTAGAERAPAPPPFSMDQYSVMFWQSAQESMNYWRFFEQEVVDPVNRAILSQDRPYNRPSDIQSIQQAVRGAIIERSPGDIPEKSRHVLTILNNLKPHPKAKRLQTKIRKTIKEVEAQLAAEEGDTQANAA